VMQDRSLGALFGVRFSLFAIRLQAGS